MWSQSGPTAGAGRLRDVDALLVEPDVAVGRGDGREDVERRGHELPPARAAVVWRHEPLAGPDELNQAPVVGGERVGGVARLLKVDLVGYALYRCPCQRKRRGHVALEVCLPQKG